MDAWNGTFEMIDPRLIVSDHSYQRDQKNHIHDIAANFDWEKFGVVSCAKRSNGTFYAIDGQQRVAAALLLPDPPQKVPAVWFTSAAVEREADTFGGLNNRKPLAPLEKHKARVRAKDPVALAIERAVATAGYTIGANYDSPKSIAAVGALQRIFDEFGEDGLVHVLVILRDAWGEDKASVSAPILNGLCDVAIEQNGGFTRPKVTAALRKTSAARVLRKAEDIHYEQGTTKRVSIRRAFKALAKV